MSILTPEDGTPIDLTDLSDANVQALIKAMKECPPTWEELELQGLRIQAGRDGLN